MRSLVLFVVAACDPFYQEPPEIDPDGLPYDCERAPPAPLTPGDHVYRLSRVEVPQPGSVSDFAFDLDGVEAGTDNRFGVLLAFASDVQALQDEALASGRIATYYALRDGAWWTHSADAPAALEAAIPGAVDEHGVFAGDGGTALLSLVLAEAVPPVQLTLWGAAVRAAVGDEGFGDPASCVRASLGGGIRTADVEAVLVPAILEAATAILNGDRHPRDGQPDCVCSPDSVRVCQDPVGWPNELGAIFDDDDDCAITILELYAEPFFQSLVEPDVDLFEEEEGPDALSVGVGIHGVRAEFL